MSARTSKAQGQADDKTASTYLRLALLLFSKDRVPFGEIDDVLCNGEAAMLKRSTINKRRQRAREALEHCGISMHLRRPNNISCWEVDTSCLSTGTLDNKEAQLIRALAIPFLRDPSYTPWRLYLPMALAKLSDKHEVVLPTALPANFLNEEDDTVDPHVALMLGKALRLRKTVVFDYQDKQGKTTRPEVDPVGFFSVRRNSYLACYLVGGPDDGEPRTYRLDRIKNTPELGERRGTHQGVDASSFIKLPFQIGDDHIACTFDVSKVNLSRFAEVVGKRQAPPLGSITWTVDAANVEDAAAWAIATDEHLLPLNPPELVNAWRHILSLNGSRITLAPLPEVSLTKGSGRKGPGKTLRMLLAIAASLTHKGEQVSAQDVSRRFGVDMNEATILLGLVMDAAGDPTTQNLLLLLDPEYASDETTITCLKALGESPSKLGPLRLTSVEAIALEGVLNGAGVPDTWPARTAIREKLWPSGSVTTQQETQGVIQTLAPPAPTGANGVYPKLLCCVVADLQEKTLEFSYQGQRDKQPRRRTIANPRPWLNNERWMVDAEALDTGGETRTFQVSLMESPTIGSAAPSAPSKPADTAHRREVTLTFCGSRMLRLLDWQTLDVIGHEDHYLDAYGTKELCIPYYIGSIAYTGSPWLLRNIAAAGGSVAPDDDELWDEVRAYAARQLAKLP